VWGGVNEKPLGKENNNANESVQKAGPTPKNHKTQKRQKDIICAPASNKA